MTEQECIELLDKYLAIENSDSVGAVPFKDVPLIGDTMIKQYGWTKERLLKKWYSIFWIWYENF